MAKVLLEDIGSFVCRSGEAINVLTDCRHGLTPIQHRKEAVDRLRDALQDVELSEDHPQVDSLCEMVMMGVGMTVELHTDHSASITLHPSFSEWPVIEIVHTM